MNIFFWCSRWLVYYEILLMKIKKGWYKLDKRKEKKKNIEGNNGKWYKISPKINKIR
jgi:hypothetical protein